MMTAEYYHCYTLTLFMLFLLFFFLAIFFKVYICNHGRYSIFLNFVLFFTKAFLVLLSHHHSHILTGCRKFHQVDYQNLLNKCSI